MKRGKLILAACCLTSLTYLGFQLTESELMVRSKYQHGHSKVALQLASYTNRSHAIVPKAQRKVTAKIYIYELPTKFNEHVTNSFHGGCFDHSHKGYGTPFETFPGLTLRNTYQGNLEPIFYGRMMTSKYRTMDPSEADMFYVPFFNFLTWHFFTTNTTALHDELGSHLGKLKYYREGKPHFFTPGWPESIFAPQMDKWNFTYVLYERYDLISPPRKNIILAPYPSYGHFNEHNGGGYIKNLYLLPRNVRIFMAAKNRDATHKATTFRHKIFTLVKDVTEKPVADFFLEKNISATSMIPFVTFSPKNSCIKASKHKDITEWMHNSVFCLQPPGDSNSRKSFFDSMISGCIPVRFQLPYVKHVSYPFESILDYTKFSVLIPSDKSLDFIEVLQSFDEDAVEEMQMNVRRVVPYLQYNDLLTENIGPDAFGMILKDLAVHFGV